MVVLYASYALFAIAFTGVIAIDPKYLGVLDAVLKLYVSLFVIIRFNPWAKKAADKKAWYFDRRIAFSGGVLLLTGAAAGIINKFADKAASHARTILE